MGDQVASGDTGWGRNLTNWIIDFVKLYCETCAHTGRKRERKRESKKERVRNLGICLLVRLSPTHVSSLPREQPCFSELELLQQTEVMNPH